MPNWTPNELWNGFVQICSRLAAIDGVVGDTGVTSLAHHGTVPHRHLDFSFFLSNKSNLA